MASLTPFLDLFGPDTALMTVLLVASGIGLVALAASNAIEGRKDIKRRTSEGLGDGPGAEAGIASEYASLQRLVRYIETTFSGGDPHEKRLIRVQLVQAGFFDQRGVAIFFAVASCDGARPWPGRACRLTLSAD